MNYNYRSSQSYSDLSSRGRLIIWAIVLFAVVPFCGFFGGMTVSAIFPPIGDLMAPMACSNGTLQFNSHTFSTGYSTSYAPSYDCVDSATGASENISAAIDYIGGGVVAVVGFIGVALIMIMVGAIRALTGKSFIP